MERANDRSDQSYRGRGSRSYAATKVYLDTLGASVSEMVAQPDHGVTTIFVNLANAKIELIAPLGNASPIEKFLESNPEGGIHHVCYEVNDIVAAREQLKAGGARMLGDEPKIGGLLRHARRARAGVSGPVDRPVDSRRIEVRCRTRCEN